MEAATGNSDIKLEPARLRRFRLGMALTWIPFVLVAVPSVVHATSRSVYKETGLGFGAFSGLSPAATVTVAAAVIVAEVLAVILLVRSINKNDPMRSALAIMSTCCSVLMIALVGFYLWLVFFGLPNFGV